MVYVQKTTHFVKFGFRLKNPYSLLCHIVYFMTSGKKILFPFCLYRMNNLFDGHGKKFNGTQ